MAKYVVLEFDDDEAADKFIQGVKEIERVDLLHPGVSVATGFLTKIVGVYKKPTQFCTCTSGFGMKAGTGGGFTRGKKYGWWIHAKCKKPRPAWAYAARWDAALGRNLLGDYSDEREDSVHGT